MAVSVEPIKPAISLIITRLINKAWLRRDAGEGAGVKQLGVKASASSNGEVRWLHSANEAARPDSRQ